MCSEFAPKHVHNEKFVKFWGVLKGKVFQAFFQLDKYRISGRRCACAVNFSYKIVQFIPLRWLCRLSKIIRHIFFHFINRIFVANDYPLNLEQLFTFNSLMYHYETLQKKFITSTSITRKKLIKLPKSKKATSDKCN